MCTQDIVEYTCGHTKRYEVIWCSRKDCRRTTPFYTELRNRCSQCRAADASGKGKGSSRNKARYCY